MLRCYTTEGLPSSSKGPFNQFTEVSIRGHHLLIYFFVGTHLIFQGVYARGNLKQLKKLAKMFSYTILPKPQLRGVKYTSLRSEVCSIFN